MKREAIFFDNDGVLVDTERFYYLATKEIMALEGFDLSEEVYAEYFLKNSLGAWHLLSQLRVSEKRIAQLREERNRRYANYLRNESILISGVEETLLRLHGKVIMGVVSSSRKEHFEIIHKRTGLLRFFDFVITGGDYQHSKPSPEPYLKALAITKKTPSACLVIEDSERGLVSAKAAGIDCWVIPSHLSARVLDVEKSDRVLNRIEEIPELLGLG